MKKKVMRYTCSFHKIHRVEAESSWFIQWRNRKGGGGGGQSEIFADVWGKRGKEKRENG